MKEKNSMKKSVIAWYDPENNDIWHCGHISINPEWCLDPHEKTVKGRYFENK